MKSVLTVFVIGLSLLNPSHSVGQKQAAKRPAPATNKSPEWHFVVSGDSRNCGDMIMPAIALGAARHKAEFYWHLGDFRAMHAPDQDLLGELEETGKTRQNLSLNEYQELAWDDFIKMQIAPFQKLDVPVVLGIGNHELVPPKDRAQYIAKFSKWIDAPVIKAQRIADDRSAQQPRTYYHWRQHGLDFINLDNGSKDQFDQQQLAWFHRVLKQDRQDPRVLTIVVGMHQSLPDGISNSHSMAESPAGLQSGRCVYKSLARFQRQTRKRVYVLASHSHFYMPNIYDTPFWRANNDVGRSILPGWIIGTAGATRPRLPENSPKGARTDVYGYLLATVNAGGKPGAVNFEFKQIHQNPGDGEEFVADDVKRLFSREAQEYCLNGNSDMRPAEVLVEPPDAPCPEDR
jgi:hypothetical protein